MTQPLAGIKVLEFSEHGFVPSAVAVLADWGADVVKIERPSGDPMRRVISDGLMPDANGFDYLFELVNRNKRGIALDVTVPDGRAVFERLARWADVYVTNQLPRVRRKLHTEPDDLFALNPTLVYAKGHGQGQRGPDAEAGGFDFVSYWARGGVGYLLTDPDAPRPTHQRGAMGDIPTGGWFAGGICAGVVQALRTGKGVVVDTALLNGAAWLLGPDLAYTSATGMEASRGTPAPDKMNPLAYPYRTNDQRWVFLSMVEWRPYWPRLCRALGLDDLVDRYSLEKTDDGAAWAAVNAAISGAIGALDYDELEARLEAEGCIYAPLHGPHEVLADPAVLGNGYVMHHPEHPTAMLSAAPAQFDDELPSIRRAGPKLGEHSREVLAEVGYSSGEIDDLISRGVLLAVVNRVVLTGASSLAAGIAAGLLERGADVVVLAPDATALAPSVECSFTSEDGIGAAIAAAERALGAVDQVVHTWLAPSLVTPRAFTDLDEAEWVNGCERSMEAAWWLARRVVAPLSRTRGSLVVVVPTIGMSGGANFSMLAAAAEGMRVLVKACGRQWGAIGVTANVLAAAPHHWVSDDAADALTRSVSLSVPALGGPGDPESDLAPLIDMLGAPETHFLTAGTLVADGGIWMGL